MQTEETLTSRFKELADRLERLSNTENDSILARTVPVPIINNAIYFRSKLFTAGNSLNPLLDTAVPLLAVATRLKTTATTPNWQQLHHDLCHEIKAFEHKIQAAKYHPQTVLAARYILCTFIDEMIISTSTNASFHWKNFNLVKTFQQDSVTDDRFFLILERSSENPEQYLELLEFMYLCLSMGYEGKYRLQDKKHQEIAKIRDELFEVISKQRGEQRQTLLVETQTKAKKHFQLTCSLYLWIVAAFTLLILATVYTSFDLLLNHSATSIETLLNQINTTSISSG